MGVSANWAIRPKKWPGSLRTGRPLIINKEEELLARVGLVGQTLVAVGQAHRVLLLVTVTARESVPLPYVSGSSSL